MKKVIIIFNIVILILASCASNTNTNAKTDPSNNTNSINYPELHSNSTHIFKSEFNDNVIVIDDSVYRYLKFGTTDNTTTQSKISLKDRTRLFFHYIKTSMLGLALFKSPKTELNNILMIGLGGGSMTHFLKKYFPKIKIDSVDIDPVVVEVAKRYFFVNENENHNIFIEDGRQFVESTGKKYDLIFLDAFNAESSIPHQLTSIEFLKAIKNCLSEKGLIIINFINYDQKTYESIFKTYKSSFKYVMRFNLSKFGSSNIIIMAFDDDAKNLPADEIKDKIEKHPDIFDVSYDFKKYADTLNSDEISFTGGEIIHDN